MGSHAGDKIVQEQQILDNIIIHVILKPMQGDARNRIWGLLFSLGWEALFIVSCLFIVITDDKRHFTYTLYFMFVFYLGLLICHRRNFSALEFLKRFTRWKSFVLPVFCTAAGVALAHAASELLIGRFFSDSVKLMLPLAYGNSIPGVLLYAVTVMILKPFASELFFRKGWISFSDRSWLLFTALTSLLLEAVTVSVTLPSLIETVMLAVPLTIAYCVTKDVYVSLFVHFIFGILVNINDVIYDFMRIYFA